MIIGKKITNNEKVDIDLVSQFKKSLADVKSGRIRKLA